MKMILYKLLIAIQNNDIIEVKNYINKGVDVNVKDNDNETALMYACRGWFSRKEIVEALLKHPNIDVNVKDNDNKTALMYACRWGNNCKETVKMLLKHPNIDVNIKNKIKWTALMYACDFNCKETVKMLLKHLNIDVNVKDKNNLTALMYVCKWNYKEIVEALLKHPNIIFTDELNYCIKNHKTELVKLFYHKPVFNKLYVLQICNDEFNTIYGLGGAFEYFITSLMNNLL